MKTFILFCCCIFTNLALYAQLPALTFALEDTGSLKAINVAILPAVFKDRKCVKVTDIDPGSDTELRIVKLTDSAFHNGFIEVELTGQPMPNAGEGARGFVGIAFRIDQPNSKFECIYLRPTNGRADDQIRRNHSVQYISYPDFPWYKLRKEFPEKYESYVDLEVGVWTKVKIEVTDNTAKLFVHGAGQPTLIITDLKHGAMAKGGIGLWIGPGTEAHFKNLTITKED